MSGTSSYFRMLVVFVGTSFSPLGILAGAAKAEVNHVIHISVDGLRGDFLETLINSSPLLYPNFKRLFDEGATTFNARGDFVSASTLPNHTSMITGRPVAQPSGFPNTTHHGYVSNGTPDPDVTLHNAGNPNLSYVASTFDVTHDNGLSTALYVAKDKFLLFDQSYDSTAGAVDTTGSDNGQDKIDTYFQSFFGANLNAAYMSDMATSEYNYTFLHFTEPDSLGHGFGWGSPQWDNSVQNVDGFLGDLLQMVETDPSFAGETAIIITADHGGTLTGHGSGGPVENYIVPVMVWGPGVAPGEDLYDLNPTNRLDPVLGLPDYTAAIQPIRNGDTGNLALDLLGLSSVPGSFINASQDLAVASPFAADFDTNLAVNQTDLGLWEGGFGTATGASKAQGDADGDFDVDGIDLLAWQREYGSSLGPLQSWSTTIPEPSCLVLGLLASIGFQLRFTSRLL
jgi:hypothetical protein